MYGAGRREGGREGGREEREGGRKEREEGGREEDGKRQAGEIKLSNAKFLCFTVPEVELHHWRHSAGPRVTDEYEIGPT